MKLALFGLGHAAAHAHALPVDTGRFFAAIQQIEGHRWTDPGGALAIQLPTWRQHTRLPHRYASLPDYAFPVAERHLQWLARSLAEAGHRVSVYSLAGAWRFGLEGYLNHSRRDRLDYALRAVALYSQ